MRTQVQGRSTPTPIARRGLIGNARLSALLAALVVLTAARANAQEASRPDANAAPVSVTASAGGLVTLTGEAGTAITPSAWIEVDGPIVVGSLALARVNARLGLTTAPGESIDVANPETFKAAEAALGVARIVGRREADGQVVTTAVVAEAGFASRLPGEPGPRERLIRHAGVGVQLAERVSGAALSLLYGFDEAAGDRGYGQVMVYGQVPIPATKGALLLVGDATLSVGAFEGAKQRDVLRLGVSADLGRALELVR